jgi:hypothetical protein
MPNPLPRVPQRQPLRRTENQTGKLVAVALVSSVFSSLATAWAMTQFATHPAETKAEGASLATDLHLERAHKDQIDNAAPPEPVAVADEPGDRSQVGPAVHANLGPVGNTASDVSNLVTTLQADYSSNGYFNQRFGLMRDLDATQAAANQVQQALADGTATPAATSQNVAVLSATLDRTIARLNNLVNNTKDPTQVQISQSLKSKLEGLRATLP